MKRKKAVRYYSSFDEDFEKTKNQNYALPENYEWVRRSKRQKITDSILYGIAWAFSSVWCRLCLGMRIHGKDVLRQWGEGGFIYANHTQPVGDVFMPALVSKKRIRTVVSPSNFGIPVIGRLLPALGALPVPKEIKRLRFLEAAIEEYINMGNMIVIYPEGHVWEYYSGVRPFSETAFMFPMKTEKPSFSITTVYKKAKFRKKPALHLYIDGPYYPNIELSKRERYKELCQRIYTQMKERCAEGNFEYIKYIHRSEESGEKESEN